MKKNASFQIFKKDILSEFRTRYAFNSLFMFVVTALSIIVFSIGSEPVSNEVLSGMLWVIIFFAAMSGLSRTFVSEEERGTVLTLQLIAHPASIYTGKLIFNILLTLFLNIIISGFYLLVMDTFILQSPGIFLLTILIGSVGIAGASTILAAIIAKANTKGTLYPVIAFPILLPLLMTVISTTKMAVDGAAYSDVKGEFQVLAAYSVVVITISFLLFEHIWRD